MIGGLQKTTLLDYPGKVAATVFTAGCGFRCHFCHNPELVLPEMVKKAKLIAEEKFFEFLKSRHKLLDAVCITGGEPTLHKDLEEFIIKIKSFGLLVKLDTNGTAPQIIEGLLAKNLLDYLAMDIKAPWGKYHTVVGLNPDLAKLQQSVKIIIESGIDHEFRSTVLPSLHSREDIMTMAEQVIGARAYYLQQFRPTAKLVNGQYVREKKYSVRELEEICQSLSSIFKICKVR